VTTGRGNGAEDRGEESASAGTAPQVPWQRVHPLTPLVRLWQAVVVVALVGAQELGQRASTGGLDAPTEEIPGVLSRFLFGGGALVVVVAIVAVGGMTLSWWFTRFRVTADTLELHHGIVARHQRHARLDRVQAVDVVRPFVPRLFGLAKLTVEVAGGSDSRIDLAYLTYKQAVRLRAELVTLATGRRETSGVVEDEVVAGTGHDPDPGQDTPEAGASDVPEAGLDVSVSRLVGSLMLSESGVWLIGVFLAATAVSVFGGLGGFLTIAVPAGLPAAGVLWKRVNAGFAFRIATSAEGLRLRHGLLEERHQTVHPNRVQAVRLRQPLLWRMVDWWRVEVNIAGYGRAGREIDTEHVLLPVGTRAEAVTVLSFVLADLGVDDRERDRLLGVGLIGDGEAEGFRTGSRQAFWLSPLSWRRNGFRATPRVLLVRCGWARRTLDVVPHARTQSCGVTQGPVQRVLGVASFRLHSTPGPVSAKVPHLRAEDAAALLTTQAIRARHARSGKV
jgi:putative membrane protein